MSCEGNDRVAPPQLNFTLETESGFNNKQYDWSSAEIQSQLPTDILLITEKDHESNACYSYMNNVRRGYCKELGCIDFGQFGVKDDQKVALMKFKLGSNKEGLLAVKNAAEILKPKVVLFVGICASMKTDKKVKLGDVVVSAKLGTKDKKVMPDGTVNYCVAKVSENMAPLILSAADGWKPPLKDPSSLNVEVHRDAVMLSGSDKVDNCKRRKDLAYYCQDALGLEMEDAVNNAKVVSFADDTNLFKCVDSHIYSASIQSDLDNLEEWRLLLDLYLIKLNASVRELP
ncbi:5 -methylthioadenosine S-adenosylhomocysteine nucleosidase [Paramuricea clavata]|uniref:5 -methylthioadenosine S-adenosylhomocysteine nucleosidase n=1 Tax=Paramuricea clavata TaxID=317549 RepID=A0A6S7I412_PARCT|nr:5 -methylthioadenosine S-adenosylhomocysteine nucleosidase [Paramuricea clavata]